MSRLDELKAKLRARAGKREYRDSIPMIEAEIARLEAIPDEPPADVPQPKEWR